MPCNNTVIFCEMTSIGRAADTMANFAIGGVRPSSYATMSDLVI